MRAGADPPGQWHSLRVAMEITLAGLTHIKQTKAKRAARTKAMPRGLQKDAEWEAYQNCCLFGIQFIMKSMPAP